MMTITMLTFVIGSFCGMKDVNISSDKKKDCFDFMANCAVIESGTTTNKRVDYCKEQWIKFERDFYGRRS